ncbi:hypothetical protein V6N12_058765 [Hibiscus sabdariffa]|uniref:Uncharacterized protein n=1 Tax=Hibiscus sabdariffa TaxID=183260 RepID=A0ABR2ET35_9ROSI
MWKPSIPPFASIPHRLAAIASNCAALLPTLVGSFIHKETECKKGEENGSFRNPGGRMGPGIVKDEDDIGKTSKGERELKGNAVVTESNGVNGQVMVSSHSDSSSEVNWNLSPEVDRNIETYENEIALNGDCLGKESNDNGGSLELDSKRHLGVKEPRGCNQGDILGKSPPDIHGENKSSDEDNTVNHGTFDRNMAEVEVCGTKAVESLEGWTKAVESLECELKKDGPGVDTQLEMGENITALHVGVAKDIIGICFNKKDITCLSPETWVSTKSVWKAIIDEQNKSINKTIEERKFSGPVNSDPLFARKEEEALHSDLKSVKQGGKRYGSLWAYQDKVFSEVEKKKRDRAFKKANKKSKGDEVLELSRHSLTDSDMSYR